MKTKIYLTAFFGLVVQVITYGQIQDVNSTGNQSSFNFSFWTSYASDKLHLNAAEQKEFIDAHKRSQSEAIPAGPSGNQKQIPNPGNNVMAGPCINIDFESGNLGGWLPTTGFHPLFNPIGCCPNPGGAQLITSGPGLDPAGGFPIVAPGGSFSLRLGDNQTGGHADRVEQTFFVTPANANFTYKYAVVLQDPGHIASQQPAFQVEMVDSTNTQVPCTFYNVVAGANIPGFQNSPGGGGVVFKPWSNVMVDLTSYIGQNITIRFTTYDCALGGHYGYAYIDGICQAFVSGTSDSICSGAVKNYCAPTGLLSYTWTGPGIANNNNQCINASAAGIYTCQTTLMSGCSGPVFTYTLNFFPNPVVSFNHTSTSACAQQYTFTNTSSIPNGYIASYNWNFGNMNSWQPNVVNNFPGPGTYPVTLTAISNHSCVGSATQTIAIYPAPVASFTANNACQNATVNFMNTSNAGGGSIISNTWTFGNGNSSNAVNPGESYLNAGSYPITLSVTSNQGCVSTTTGMVTVYPLPNVSFGVNNSCLGSATNFTNSSNIASGAIQGYFWYFNNPNQFNSLAVNPSYTYPSPGTYTVKLVAESNFYCINSATAQVQVYANPTASFAVQNACFGQNIGFTNLSSVNNGDQIISYSWNLGNGNFTNVATPAYNYSAPGTYTVNLIVTSNHNCTSTYSSLATAYDVPLVSFTSNSACQNQATQFNNSSIIHTGSINKWHWDFENDGIWDDTISVNPSLIYPAPGTYSCKLQVISNNGCAGEMVNTVLVHANPVADFLNSTACLGDASTFTNTSSSSDGVITSYQWDFNGDNVIDNVNANPTITYSTNGVYLLKLEVYSIFGCVNVKSKSMYVNPKPLPAFSAVNNTGCPNLCTSFTNMSSIPTGSIKAMQWVFGDGSSPEHITNPTHCYNAGNYDVSLILMSDSGCVSVLKKPSFVKAYPAPVAGFTVNPEEIDENEPVIHVSNEAVGATQVSYYMNDNFSTNLLNFDHTIKNVDKVKPLIYQVVKNEYGCVDTAVKVLKIKPSFVVYIPNTFTPNGDGLNDGWFAKGVGVIDFTVQVYDRWGHVIFETHDMDHAWDGTMKGSTEPIKQDVYVWHAVVTDVFHKNHDLAGTVTLIK